MSSPFLTGFYKAAAMSSQVRRGYDRMAHRSGGLDSIVSAPLALLSRMVVGKKKTYKASRAIHRAGLKVDTALGSLPHKILQHKFSKRLGLNHLFEQTDIVPINRHKGLHQEIKRPSILAPITKASEIVVPLATGLQLSKAIHHKGKIEQPAAS